MHNDDFTPMEFVIAALEVFFHMERSIATRIMYEVHKTGKAICGIYSRDIAETKVDKVIEHARRHEYPLLCSIEVT
jgi:ATP-dependent Clp protease adaptor protein ClpS